MAKRPHPELPEATVSLKIPFHDVDMMTITWHGHYVRYFEIARCALLDKVNFNYLAMAATGYAWPVIDLRVQYVKPARFEDEIQVTAYFIEWENRLKIGYEIFNQHGEKLTKGYSVQVAVDMKNNEMQFNSPAILLQRLGVTSAETAE